ncbi:MULTISPECIES: transglutaminase-like domain-containing protein [unclassified Streptomyces]|uniref:transglutaminase-like domain-containing protein n=1 Tax=unclassified Streptomyces TaxID=2593676 RepID=UPI00166163FA|nr:MULTISPECIES: transglutaminase family protein [unclassified Streptomyces]MBD0706963.1 transglutaminase [Streptomyces sp. CBMA291]MBD0710350.1 transglutaminase [Streptomyces sp. CBMA291]MBD0717307.1 transglutaminase [Streptomyces sp. CBMA370]
MELIQQNPDIAAYLAPGEAVDHEHPTVGRVVEHLSREHPDAYAYAEAAFAHVRDTIPHSADSGDLRVTWRASDVLEERTGICYAKAVAYAALLRARGIPAALCYQRLADDDGSRPVLHGLVAVLLPGERTWARQDPRGNKPGVDARFSIGEERLAWTVRPEFNEVDYPVLYAEPHPVVLDALRAAPDRPTLWRTLPTEL